MFGKCNVSLCNTGWGCCSVQVRAGQSGYHQLKFDSIQDKLTQKNTQRASCEQGFFFNPSSYLTMCPLEVTLTVTALLSKIANVCFALLLQ